MLSGGNLMRNNVRHKDPDLGPTLPRFEAAITTRGHRTESGSMARPWSILACLVYNLLNASLLAWVIRTMTIIRSDGPGGFGELIIKGYITNICLALFIFSVVISVKAFRARKASLLIMLCLVPTAILLFFSGVAVVEACTDDGGYCREWQLASALALF